MPSVSQAEVRFWQVMAHNPAARKAKGIKLSTAQEFVAADRTRDTKKLPERKTPKK